MPLLDIQACSHKPIDRVAMIEAASRNLRQQVGKNQDRAWSRGTDSSMSTIVVDDAQRRNHSAENQHRLVSASRCGTRDGGYLNSTSSSSALDPYPPEEETLRCPGNVCLDDVPPFPDVKRPLSRKKGPSASAAAGLGELSGPARLTDAFEQRKTRHPIPVESWGPRPPSRHGIKTVNSDVGGLDEDGKMLVSNSRNRVVENCTTQTGGRPNSRTSTEGGTKALKAGGTWAAARGGASFRGLSDPGVSRRGRRPPQAVRNACCADDLGVSGRGTRPPSQQQHLKGSGAALSSSGSFGDDGSQRFPWGTDVGTDGQEEFRMSSPQSSTSPMRRGRHNVDVLAPVSLEDVEADADASYWTSDRPLQVIVTRSQQGKGRGDPRRRCDQRNRDQAQGNMRFDTKLDVGFLSLFAA
eukprot:TRINITY_DN67774_c0_g1_i1.p1 TRINITY_DN67774_c0_g1~~TRINITY_DN67774_c0_g1_i1.p1  ORF type:complete len:411 (-),score=56.98 TRINITY_DN67774_c0_g1_i1:196-1428(-)